MKKIVFFSLIVAALFFVMAEPALANPFVSGRPSQVNSTFMGFFPSPFLQQILSLQAQIHQAITQHIEALKDGQSLAALWSLLVFSFAYGVFHVLAPGHGKVIVGSYFLGNNANWREGVWAGFLMALGHTITAIGIVAVLAMVFGLGDLVVENDSRYMELAGYALIAAIGVWLLIRALRNTPECGACGHQHHQHGHYDHEHLPDLVKKPSTGLFVAASLVPCTGSMIILMFTLANGILWAGILAVILIALGMWITISVIGLASMLLRRAIFGDDEQSGPKKTMLMKAVRVLAALMVLATGSLLFIGTLYSLQGAGS